MEKEDYVEKERKRDAKGDLLRKSVQHHTFGASYRPQIDSDCSVDTAPELWISPP